MTSPATVGGDERLRLFLALRLPDPRNLVLFIGFQAPGTHGFLIKNGAPEVKIFGEMVAIRAQTAAFEQFSDHADTPELLQWLHTFPKKPAVTYLVHGEPAAASQLRDAMTKELGWDVQVAQWLQKVEVTFDGGPASSPGSPESVHSRTRGPASSKKEALTFPHKRIEHALGAEAEPAPPVRIDRHPEREVHRPEQRVGRLHHPVHQRHQQRLLGHLGELQVAAAARRGLAR